MPAEETEFVVVGAGAAAEDGRQPISRAPRLKRTSRVTAVRVTILQASGRPDGSEGRPARHRGEHQDGDRTAVTKRSKSGPADGWAAAMRRHRLSAIGATGPTGAVDYAHRPSQGSTLM